MTGALSMRRGACRRNWSLLRVGIWLLTASLAGAAPSPILPRNQDAFFAEDNLVYSRYLSLARDGTYRQINQDRQTTVEADQGTWEQDPAGTAVSLHSTLRGLRFRALLSGPLSVVPDEVAKLDALPALAAVVRRALAASEAEVFAASHVTDLCVPPAAVAVDPRAETFSRVDLTGLLAQLDQAIRTEAMRTYRFLPVRLPGRPLLLVLQGATFGPERAAQTCREYGVGRGGAPPFYFAQVGAREFARRVGVWRELRFPGDPYEP